MFRAASLLLLACALAIHPLAGDDDVVFRSDVSLVRVDAQVLDSNNRAITHLQAGDFVLRANGRVVPIRNFASENMPMDVLFLLDVSASMRPHVQRIADASGQALTVLGKNDRMGIMVFDRYTRVRLAFNGDPQQVQREFDRLLRQERFNGGTDITRAMLDAADYIRTEGRRDARRAIVILTDDRTEFDRDDVGVGRALARADAVMCALIAPDAMAYGGRRGGGQRPGGWGSGGPGLGGPLGGIIFGPRGGGNRYPGGGGGGTSSEQSAGTSEIARDSGGDSMSVDDASALEDTLSRLRQRYTLYFNLPEGVQPGQERNIEVDLAPDARRRYSDAEVHYRRTSMSGNGSRDAAPVHITRAPSDSDYSTPSSSSSSTDSDSSTPVHHRRVAVNQDGTSISAPATDDNTPNSAPPPSH
ncbi:MAG: VWA domain-containing protein [Bryobacterales bacterium]|nr:VWA domain-containing protein [Bryobacterales bacterium]